ncbi:MAG: FecCD family ABC transporter permease [Lachnospirales bacterium]
MSKNFKKVMILLCFLFIVAFVLSLSWGTYIMTPSEIFQTLIGNGTKNQNITIWSLRLPRISVAILVGICLSTAGCLLQTVTKNDLAEPGMIGINSGSALFVVLWISYGTTSYYDTLGGFAQYLMPIISIIGAFLSWSLVYFLSNKKGVLNPTRLILTGIGVNIGTNAFISLYSLTMSRGDFNQVLTWTNGSLWGSTWEYFYLILPFVIVIMFFVVYKMKVLDVLTLGDELAIGLGVNVDKERKVLAVLAVCLGGIATSVAGNIAFLGLLAPQLAKQLVGPTHKKLVPTSAIIGTIIIVFADLLSRNLFSPVEIPVGITISVVGVPYFVYLLMKE